TLAGPSGDSGARRRCADGLGGVFSVALSRGFPRVGVTDHPALRCPDFPRRAIPSRLLGQHDHGSAQGNLLATIRMTGKRYYGHTMSYDVIYINQEGVETPVAHHL